MTLTRGFDGIATPVVVGVRRDTPKLEIAEIAAGTQTAGRSFCGRENGPSSTTLSRTGSRGVRVKVYDSMSASQKPFPAARVTDPAARPKAL
ncbi:hypothetical protein [Rhodococcus sp. ARC_M6]|uniref:hypothetical protein n=1 Tax=Rhodococcus sp. ARC_M6 TaxID=2928852 RepID=UPI001FB322B1|nr:hypothetical protein [Rhodococcus sp. ARC_M6]MCJ0903444.1 hypothetical protein [Rhodococcus sp. ARC_M6]